MTLLFSLICLAFQPGRSETEIVKAFKISSPPVIDGILDESVWKEAPAFSDFKSFIPDFGKEVPQRTKAWVAYDEENIYLSLIHI